MFAPLVAKPKTKVEASPGKKAARPPRTASSLGAQAFAASQDIGGGSDGRAPLTQVSLARLDGARNEFTRPVRDLTNSHLQRRLDVGPSPFTRALLPAGASASVIQRTCATCRSAQEDEDLAAGTVRRKGDSHAGLAAPPPPASTARDLGPLAPVRRLAEGSGGRPLPLPLRTTMEAGFGHRFSDVRVHDDGPAAEATRAVGAVAYTLGRDIAFSAGAFRPHTPEGRHLIAHELAHVVQQSGAPASGGDLSVGAADDPLEHEADRAAAAVARGEKVSPQQLGPGTVQRRVQRSVSKVCNPPSAWFALAGPMNLPAAVAFGAIAELFISADVVAKTGVAVGNFYLDNPLAGPIDPLLVAFIIGKNPGLSTVNKLLLGATSMVRPDVLMHQAALTEFEEVKPDSAPGRAAGRAKVAALQAIYSGFGLPYTAGTTYIPGPPFVIVSGSIGGVPLTVTFEVTRGVNGLLVYNLCVETDWTKVALAALALIALIILILISRGAVRPIPMPGPVPVPAMAMAGGTQPGAESARGDANPAGSSASPAVAAAPTSDQG